MKLDGAERQPDVAGGHRHLHRRAGGRRDRRGGERLQQDPALAGRRAGRATSTRCGWRRCWRWARASSSRCSSSRWPSCPVFTLVDQEGRLFRPLAYLQEPGHGHRRAAGDHARSRDADALRAHGALPLPAALAGWLATAPAGRHATTPEERHPVAALLHRAVRGALPLRAAPRRGPPSVGGALVLVARRFPSTCGWARSSCHRSTRGPSSTCPRRCSPACRSPRRRAALQVQDKILMTFPEVERVFGKAGRADTSTDPAPLTMMETTVLLKPEPSGARAALVLGLGAGVAEGVLRSFWRTASPRTSWRRDGRALRLPGISNAWTMPIKGRLDMLSTGIRTPVGIKIVGADLRDDRDGRPRRLEAAVSQGAGHAQRVRRARRRRLLPRLRAQARRSSPATASAWTTPTPW